MRRGLFGIFRVCALIGMAACGPVAFDRAALPVEPVIVEDAVIESQSLDCPATDMEDGIGGTGCPAID